MGDEAFQNKKNEPTHISLRCLEQAVCCIMYCNSGPNFAVLRTWCQMTLNAGPRRLGYRKKKRGGPKQVQYGFCRESKRHYEQSRAGTRIHIGYALVMEAASTGTLPRRLGWWLQLPLMAVVSLLSLICWSCLMSLFKGEKKSKPTWPCVKKWLPPKPNNWLGHP